MKTVSVLVLSLCLMPLSCSALSEVCSTEGKVAYRDDHQIILAIPGREQWENNDGYCGEVSLISAGLYYGQYISQYDVRHFANQPFAFKNKQLTDAIIGYYGDTSRSNNIIHAVTHLHLNYEQFNNTHPKTQNTSAFLLWIKNHVLLSHPVFLGVYENTSFFGDIGEPEYDHIVPVFGIQSEHPLSEKPAQYYSDDVFYLHDNHLYTGTGYSPKNCYQYMAGAFQKTRLQANNPSGNIYSLSKNANQLGNFGMAITGVKAKGAVLMPVSIQTNPLFEYPEIQEGTNIRPAPTSLTLTITVSHLKTGVSYILYKYTAFDQLPKNDDFGKSYGTPASKCSIWITSGSQFTTQEQILSRDIAIYRAIEAKNGSPIPPACP